MADILRFADNLGPAKIVQVYEPSIDLKAILVIDNIALGPAIGGIRVVQSFTREPYEIQRFRQNIEKTFQLAMRRTRISSLFGPIISFMGFAAVASIFWFGGHEVLAGRLTAGQLFMFITLTLVIAGSIGSFSGLWTGLQETLGATKRLFEILDTQPDILDRPGAQPLGRVMPKPVRIGVVIGEPLDFSRYQGMANDRFILRSVTDEIMYALMRLSGQEYVDMYAATAKARIAAGHRPDEVASAEQGHGGPGGRLVTDVHVPVPPEEPGQPSVG